MSVRSGAYHAPYWVVPTRLYWATQAHLAEYHYSYTSMLDTTTFPTIYKLLYTLHYTVPRPFRAPSGLRRAYLPCGLMGGGWTFPMCPRRAHSSKHFPIQSISALLLAPSFLTTRPLTPAGMRLCDRLQTRKSPRASPRPSTQEPGASPRPYISSTTHLSFPHLSVPGTH